MNNVTTQSIKQKPRSILVLAFLFFVLGVFGIIRGLYPDRGKVFIPIVSDIFSFLGLPSSELFIFLSISVLFFSIAIGLYFLKNWARILAIIYAVFLSLTVVMIPISIIMIYFLMRAETKKYFRS